MVHYTQEFNLKLSVDVKDIEAAAGVKIGEDGKTKEDILEIVDDRFDAITEMIKIMLEDMSVENDIEAFNVEVELL